MVSLETFNKRLIIVSLSAGLFRMPKSVLKWLNSTVSEEHGFNF